MIETVYVHNARPDELAIQMISISGNTEHFHCSFFEDKIVPALSNTTFQVVFLARQEGLVSQQLFIHRLEYPNPNIPIPYHLSNIPLYTPVL